MISVELKRKLFVRGTLARVVYVVVIMNTHLMYPMPTVPRASRAAPASAVWPI